MIQFGNQFLIALWAVGLTGSLSLLLFERFQENIVNKLGVRTSYLFLKFLTGYFLLPSMFVAGAAVHSVRKFRVIEVNQPDFSRMVGVRYLLFSDSWVGRYFHYVVFAVFGIWVLGGVCFGLYPLCREERQFRKLMAQNIPAASPVIERMLKDIQSEQNISRKVRIFYNKHIQSPFITGLFSFSVVLPCQDIPEEKMEMILRHEMVHCRCYDTVYKLLFSILSMMYWFNPLMKRLIKLFYDYCEYNADNQAVIHRGLAFRKEYAYALIELASVSDDMPQSMLFAYKENKSMVERRIGMMKRLRGTMGRVKACVAVGISAAAIGTMTAVSAYAAVAGQDAAIELYRNATGTFYETILDTPHTFQVDPAKVARRTDAVSQSERAGNTLDFTLGAQEETTVLDLELNVGSKVRIFVGAENSTDAFKVGLMDSSGTVSVVSSRDGIAAYSYTVRNAGSYRVYFKGLNQAGKDMVITGNVNVTY